MTPRLGLSTSGSTNGGVTPLSLGFRSWALAAGVATPGVAGGENVMMGRRQERPSPSREGIVRSHAHSRRYRTLRARPASMDPCENKHGDWPCRVIT